MLKIHHTWCPVWHNYEFAVLSWGHIVNLEETEGVDHTQLINFEFQDSVNLSSANFIDIYKLILPWFSNKVILIILIMYNEENLLFTIMAEACNRQLNQNNSKERDIH